MTASTASLLQEGVMLHRRGALGEAAHRYAEVLRGDPINAEALYYLAVIACQEGRFEQGIEFARRALAIDSKQARAHNLLGLAQARLGDNGAALKSFDAALACQPDFAEAHGNRANALADLGRRSEALAGYDRAVGLRPESFEDWCNRGSVLLELKRYGEAIESYDRALRLKPDFFAALVQRGVALAGAGRHQEALQSYDDALRLDSANADAYNNRGNTLRKLGRHEEALASFDRAIGVAPNHLAALCNRAAVLNDLGRCDAALANCDKALQISPGHINALCNRGQALFELGRFDEAVSCYRRAIDIKHDDADAHCSLANALRDQGKLEAAIAAYRQTIGIRPDFVAAHSSLLFCLNCSDTPSLDYLFSAHRDWDERHARTAPRAIPHANDRAAERRLRIGYVSPDFREHSVAYFLEPLLSAHDRQAVEVFCYAEVKRPDAVTARLKGFGDHWIETVGLSDNALAERIREDRIDILVDLAGHTSGNRLTVFGYKPAPIQVTWLGYPNTTGLTAVDYRLVDAVTDPAGADAWATETLVRLDDGFLCYGPPRDAPEPAAPPCLNAGMVTFGSFNNPTKLSPATLDAWASLLARLPRARLLLKGRPFVDAATRDLLLARFARRGIAADRIELAGWLPSSAAHLSFYGRIDVALDPFPYNGATTTCEALWMGVPVVTLQGDRHAGRVGASLLTRVGLSEFIADSPERYVEIACALAGDPHRLADLRLSLRPRMAASPLCDGRAFARKMEKTFRRMWRQWCEAPPKETASPDGPRAIAWQERSALPVRIRDGLTIAVPPNLSAITTYVLLEQEDWFEKEIHFLRRCIEPGMTAIDVGANLGVYSLTLARLVGPHGRVFAYEPGSEARRLLTHSRTLNNLGNLEIIDAALSDGERQGYLAFAASSELRALGSSEAGEVVRVTSLDIEDAARGWSSPDFVKIDAEGEEERILAGGRAFFSAHSPLVMFEVKVETSVNNPLPAIFQGMGYRVFRLLAGAPILVPHDIAQSLDAFELNLFAAKPDRATALTQRGWLVETIPFWAPSDADRHDALGFWRLQEFCRPLMACGVAAEARDCDYRDALAAYATWRNLNQPAPTRCGALLFALQTLRALCARAATAERLSSWARVACEWGARSESVAALQRLLQTTQAARVTLTEPLWPAGARFDDIPPGAEPAGWLAAAAAEQLERSSAFSSAFGNASPNLASMCRQEFASAEMERRRTLLAARAGLQPEVPARLRTAEQDHLNADVWRRGLVPGTVLGIS